MIIVTPGYITCSASSNGFFFVARRWANFKEIMTSECEGTFEHLLSRNSDDRILECLKRSKYDLGLFWRSGSEESAFSWKPDAAIQDESGQRRRRNDDWALRTPKRRLNQIHIRYYVSGCMVNEEVKEKYPLMAKEARKRLLPFPSTYLVECAFSTVVDILAPKRGRLDVTARGDLRLKLTGLTPNIKKLLLKHEAQGSHWVSRLSKLQCAWYFVLSILIASDWLFAKLNE